MKKIFLILLVAFIFSGLAYWQKNKLFSSGLKIPIFSREPIIVLSENLEKAGLVFSTSPIISLGTIEASISGVRVYFDSTKDFSNQVRALQLVLARHTIDKIPKEIDLRFNGVVLRY